jgi:hypothetical protein
MTALPHYLNPDWYEQIDQHHALISSHTDWRIVGDRQGVRSAILVRTDEPDYVACHAMLPVAADTLAAYLIDDILTTLGEWNPLYTGGRVLATSSVARLLHLEFRSAGPLIARRDNLIAVARVAHPDGTICELSADDQHTAFPPAPGVVRMLLPFASKQITPLTDATCTYSVIWQTDPGGRLSYLPQRLLTRLVLNDLQGELRRLKQRFAQGTLSQST